MRKFIWQLSSYVAIKLGELHNNEQVVLLCAQRPRVGQRGANMYIHIYIKKKNIYTT